MLAKRTFFWVISLFAVVGAAVWYLSLNSQKSRQPPPQAAAPESPAVRYPIEADKAPNCLTSKAATSGDSVS
jgi:hypothetical protein